MDTKYEDDSPPLLLILRLIAANFSLFMACPGSEDLTRLSDAIHNTKI